MFKSRESLFARICGPLIPPPPPPPLPKSRLDQSNDVLPGWFYQKIMNRGDMRVVGSYALEQLQNTDWRASDIDICSGDPAIFHATVDKLRKHELVQNLIVSESHYPVFGDDRMVASFRIAGVDRPVQIILIPHGGPNALTTDEKYRWYADLVGQISYTVDDKGRKVYSIPEDARRIAIEGLRIRSDFGANHRAETYQPRLKPCDSKAKYQFKPELPKP